MTPESTVVITFHRTYELEVPEVVNRLKDEGYEDVEITENLVLEKAEEYAREMIEDEMTMFSENSQDFVSATKEFRKHE